MHAVLMTAFPFVAPALAQDTSGMKTGFNVNGRYWITLSVEAKATYLIAFQAGIVAAVHAAPQNCTCAFDGAMATLEATGGGSTSSIADMGEGLDSFYKESANRAVPVPDALKYVTKKITGATRQELDYLESSLRRDANR
jgi:hypothetical protein